MAEPVWAPFLWPKAGGIDKFGKHLAQYCWLNTTKELFKKKEQKLWTQSYAYALAVHKQYRIIEM